VGIHTQSEINQGYLTLAIVNHGLALNTLA
jgi:hypothetical protein